METVITKTLRLQKLVRKHFLRTYAMAEMMQETCSLNKHSEI